MTRRQFDQDKVLDQSVATFLLHGYHATSMQQIFTATGLKPGSVYMAFGNKAGLFQASVDHYLVQGIEVIQATIEREGSVGKGICAILRCYVQETTGEDYRGCLCLNSQMELSAQDDNDLHTWVCARMSRVEAYYAHLLAEEYTPVNAKHLAASLMIHITGLRVYGYFGQQLDDIMPVLQSGLPWLPWSEYGAH